MYNLRNKIKLISCIINNIIDSNHFKQSNIAKL
jgi:hypothetical protein